jgi:DNA-binding HxlR family transcriptional regulator
MSTLAPLFHHRWAVPILAELSRQRGSRFAALAGRLGVGRESLTRTLAALVELGLVERNPGYGHPLRPEYVLTARGAAVAEASDGLLERLDGLAGVALRKWSMPVLYALERAPRRFSELRAALPGITPRALTLALKDLERTGLVTRRITDDYPPATIYEVGRRGAPLLPPLRRVASALFGT